MDWWLAWVLFISGGVLGAIASSGLWWRAGWKAGHGDWQRKERRE